MKLSDLIKRFMNNDDLNPYNPEHMQLLKQIYGRYRSQLSTYEKMYRYYKGDTDAMRKYKFLTDRSNSKTNANFIKKFIKEEVSYTVGNPLTYDSRNDDNSIVNDIKKTMVTWNKNHDSELMKYLLIFTKVYELYYLDHGEIKAKIVKPTEGYAYCDNSGKVLFFINTYKNDFDKLNSYIDVYTSYKIYHFDNKFNEIKKPTTHLFGEVPVSIGIISEEGVDDSLYNDIKGLQDAFETNLSDISNEISDFRNAYLAFIGCTLDEEKIPEMKRLGILQSNDPKANIFWLIKNINDTFIQNTLDREVDLMYQISCHINHNERLQSNLSGVTLDSRLIALKNKCTLLIGSHYNIIVNRNKFICSHLNLTKNKQYDYRDIKARYTPNIPQDDVSTAQMLSQVPDGTISKQTGRSLFSFITNPKSEEEKVHLEQQQELDLIGNSYSEGVTE